MSASPFAEDLRVVDLSEVDVAACHRRPDAGNAAFGADAVRRATEQQEEAAPRLHVATRLDRQFADQVAVQQDGEFADGWILASRRAFVEEQ